MGHYTVCSRMLLSFFLSHFCCYTQHNLIEAGLPLQTSPTARENDAPLAMKVGFVFDNEDHAVRDGMRFVC